MMGPTGEHEPITDWSREGRSLLVREQGDRMRALLEEAFDTFLDDKAAGLMAFRFRSDDPVAEAVEWCVDRFQSADLDPQRLHPGSRSWRLFTEASFWLSQREGAAGYRRILAQFAAGAGAAPALRSDDASPEAAATTNLEARRLRDRIVAGVIVLRNACCAALVGWWLLGSARQRRAWFADGDPPSRWEAALDADDDRTPKQRSTHIADALFRYLALFADLVHRDGNESHRACVRTWFAPCDNRPPYEVSRETVLAATGDLTSRQMTTLRHDGVTTLVRRCVALAERPSGDGDPLPRALARSSLRRTVLHRFKIEDETLAARIATLKKAVE